MKSILGLVLLFAGVSLALITLDTPARQMHPDKKRTVEIQQALIAKGYMFGSPTGVWDNRTIEVLQQIAEDHKWQVDHVPDARVLILLGLGNRYSDPKVATWPGNHLDCRQRGEECPQLVIP